MSKEVVKHESGQLVSDVIPDYLKGYQGATGTENIDSQDVSIPRLKLGQAMSEEVKSGAVKDGDLFHSITKQILIPKGKTGLIIPIVYEKEYILWRDINDQGGIFARARRTVLNNGEVRYAWDKPGQTFEHKYRGAIKVSWKTGRFVEDDGLADFGSAVPGEPDSQPAATAHYNYLVALPEHGFELLALSFARTSAKKAKDWNQMLKMGQAPIFARMFNLSSVEDQNDQGQKYFNYNITPAGFLQDKAAFDALGRLHSEFKSKGVHVDWSEEENKTEEDKEAF